MNILATIEIHIAIKNKNYDMIQGLLDSGEDPNEVFETLLTDGPWFEAADKVFETGRVDINHKNEDGDSFLHSVLYTIKESGESSVEEVKYLIEKGIDVNILNADEDSAAVSAILAFDEKALMVLVENGAELSDIKTKLEDENNIEREVGIVELPDFMLNKLKTFTYEPDTVKTREEFNQEEKEFNKMKQDLFNRLESIKNIIAEVNSKSNKTEKVVEEIPEVLEELKDEQEAETTAKFTEENEIQTGEAVVPEVNDENLNLANKNGLSMIEQLSKLNEKYAILRSKALKNGDNAELERISREEFNELCAIAGKGIVKSEDLPSPATIIPNVIEEQTFSLVNDQEENSLQDNEEEAPVLEDKVENNEEANLVNYDAEITPVVIDNILPVENNEENDVTEILDDILQDKTDDDEKNEENITSVTIDTLIDEIQAENKVTPENEEGKENENLVPVKTKRILVKKEALKAVEEDYKNLERIHPKLFVDKNFVEELKEKLDEVSIKVFESGEGDAEAEMKNFDQFTGKVLTEKVKEAEGWKPATKTDPQQKKIREIASNLGWKPNGGRSK